MCGQYCRCYLAVMLLTDLVVDSVPIDWSVHLPIILHIIFIGELKTASASLILLLLCVR